MKIALRTQHYSDNERRALWWHEHQYHYAGDPATCPMASRDKCRDHLESVGRAEDDDLSYAWAQAAAYWASRPSS